MRVPAWIVIVLCLVTIGVTWWLGTRHYDFLADLPLPRTAAAPPVAEATPLELRGPPAPAPAELVTARSTPPVAPPPAAPTELQLHFGADRSLAEPLGHAAAATALRIAYASRDSVKIAPVLNLGTTSAGAGERRPVAVWFTSADNSSSTQVRSFIADPTRPEVLERQLLVTIYELVRAQLDDAGNPLQPPLRPAAARQAAPVATRETWRAFARSLCSHLPRS